MEKHIFDSGWLGDARLKYSNSSWAKAVLEDIETSGQIYLSTLRLWFNRFPATRTDDKEKLRKRLECLDDDQHLGGVNELTWWALMQSAGIGATVVPTAKAPRPDFKLGPPADCFVEVTTLNVSAKDRRNLANGNSITLDQAETVWRVVGKLTEEKRRQLLFANSQRTPAVLVVFDYTEWSSFGTSLSNTLAEFLLGPRFGFRSLAQELSAIVYLERKVLEGRIALSLERSAVYHNPMASQPLAFGSFPFLKQFSTQVASAEPELGGCWFYL